MTTLEPSTSSVLSVINYLINTSNPLASWLHKTIINNLDLDTIKPNIRPKCSEILTKLLELMGITRSISYFDHDFDGYLTSIFKYAQLSIEPGYLNQDLLSETAFVLPNKGNISLLIGDVLLSKYYEKKGGPCRTDGDEYKSFLKEKFESFGSPPILCYDTHDQAQNFACLIDYRVIQIPIVESLGMIGRFENIFLLVSMGYNHFQTIVDMVSAFEITDCVTQSEFKSFREVISPREFKKRDFSALDILKLSKEWKEYTCDLLSLIKDTNDHLYFSVILNTFARFLASDYILEEIDEKLEEYLRQYTEYDNILGLGKNCAGDAVQLSKVMGFDIKKDVFLAYNSGASEIETLEYRKLAFPFINNNFDVKPGIGYNGSLKKKTLIMVDTYKNPSFYRIPESTIVAQKPVVFSVCQLHTMDKLVRDNCFGVRKFSDYFVYYPL